MSKNFIFLKGIKAFKSCSEKLLLFWIQSFSRFLRGLRRLKSLSLLLEQLSSIKFGQSLKSRSVSWLLEQFSFCKLVNPFNLNPLFNS